MGGGGGEGSGGTGGGGGDGSGGLGAGGGGGKGGGEGGTPSTMTRMPKFSRSKAIPPQPPLASARIQVAPTQASIEYVSKFGVSAWLFLVYSRLTGGPPDAKPPHSM